MSNRITQGVSKQGLTFALILSMLVGFSFQLQAQDCTGVNDIGGVIFHDYNANGTQGTFEPGVTGITVTAYDATNTVLNSSISDENGFYVINIANGIDFRLEFSNLPAGLSYVGSPVQFGTSPNCGFDLSVVNPNLYCQSDPSIAAPCYVNGDPLLGGEAGDADVLVDFGYNQQGLTPGANLLANGSTLGSVWGVAYHKTSKKLFSAAFLKRHMGLGTQGTGGIYVTDLSGGGASSSTFIDLASLGVNTGSVGARDLPADFNVPSRDENAFESIAKVGLGDMDISGDGNTLWVVNLAENELVTVDISAYNNNGTLPNSGDISVFSIPNPNCSNGDYQAFGVKMWQGKVYVGVVCTGETSGLQSDLEANVYEFTPSTSTFSNIFNFALDYSRGEITSFPFGNNCDRWETWSNDYSDFHYNNLPDGVCYPQPILSDIEFDASGAMILGFMDRAGHQLGNDNYSPIASDLSLHSGTAAGDVVRVSNNSGFWTLENNGTAGSLVGCGVDNDMGPNGGEFYCGDDAGAGGHKESSMGGLALLFGAGEIAHPVLNPFTTETGGIAWMSNQNGSRLRQYQLYGNSPAYVGKASGIGDLEILCNPAPIMIGDYAWSDVNQNGVQDAGEPGIPGVILVLYNNTGTVIASAVTDLNGFFIFDDNNVPNGLQPNETYTISLSPMQFTPSTGLVIGSTAYPAPTTPNNGVGTQPDNNDSELLNDNNSGISSIDTQDLPYFEVVTGDYGFTDFGADLGMIPSSGTPEDCEDLFDLTVSPNEFCSGTSVSITVEHTPNAGEVTILYNVGSVLTGIELYSDNNGGATTLIESTPTDATSNTTTILNVDFPENNTNAPFPYNVYVIFADGNPNASTDC
ncbi:MAG: SdrD B-like domain-containing protein, partial [Chitinophagales bacterium]